MFRWARGGGFEWGAGRWGVGRRPLDEEKTSRVHRKGAAVNCEAQRIHSSRRERGVCAGPGRSASESAKAELDRAEIIKGASWIPTIFFDPAPRESFAPSTCPLWRESPTAVNRAVRLLRREHCGDNRCRLSTDHWRIWMRFGSQRPQ